MREQLEFRFCVSGSVRPRPKRPECLFFAIFPDAGAAALASATAERLRRENGLQARATSIGRLHLSLHCVGHFKRVQAKYVYAASQAAQSVSMPAFDVMFEEAASFPALPQRGRIARRPLVLLGGSAPLRQLHARLGQAMLSVGLRPSLSFEPHVTLLYDPRGVPRQRVDRVAWTVRQFVLIHSEKGLTRHNILGCWPLCA